MKKEEHMFNAYLSLAGSPPGNPRVVEEITRHDTYTITPIDHDYPGKTPMMWNALYRAFGIDAVMAMVVGNPSSVHDIIGSLRNDPKYVGGGSGSGFKELVIAELDAVTPLAKAIGAVNIIKRTADGLIGDNTDGVGFADSLEDMFSRQGRTLNGSDVLMLGAGGTGRAIAFTLAQRGARLTILNRTVERAIALAESVNAYIGTSVATGAGRNEISRTLPTAHAVVSVIDDAHSPLDEYSTLGDMETPVTPESIEKNNLSVIDLLQTARAALIISDIRLRTMETPMLAQARKLGFTTLDGVPMVINQGVVAFWWLYGDMLAARAVSKEDVAKIMRQAAHAKN